MSTIHNVLSRQRGHSGMWMPSRTRRRFTPVAPVLGEQLHAGDRARDRASRAPAEVGGAELVDVGVGTPSAPRDRAELHEREDVGDTERVVRVLLDEEYRRAPRA